MVMRGFFTKMLGNRGERAAARFLKRAGFKILARQYRDQFGEIDIVAMDGRCLVFVEVKTRSSTGAGHPVEAITLAKQKQMTRLALAFLKRHRLLDHSARFDVVAVIWPKGERKPVIEHYRNAFEAVGSGQLYS